MKMALAHEEIFKMIITIGKPNSKAVAHRTTLLAFTMLLAATSCLSAQSTISAPLPPQIATATHVFLSCAAGTNAATADQLYSGLYLGIKTWGKYQLVATPTDADLIFEIHYPHLLSNCSVSQGTGGCVESDRLDVQLLDRATHTVLWTVSEPNKGGRNKINQDKSTAAMIAATIADLKTIASPNATSIPRQTPPATTKSRMSQENQ
jgi:hypothetical protein